jgi:hypothetical protein
VQLWLVRTTLPILLLNCLPAATEAQTSLHGFTVDLLADRLYSKSPANMQQVYRILPQMDLSTTS